MIADEPAQRPRQGRDVVRCHQQTSTTGTVSGIAPAVVDTIGSPCEITVRARAVLTAQSGGEAAGVRLTSPTI
jgi:hypothetical protein